METTTTTTLETISSAIDGTLNRTKEAMETPNTYSDEHDEALNTTDPYALQNLAFSTDEKTRIAVIRNPHTAEGTLDCMAFADYDSMSEREGRALSKRFKEMQNFDENVKAYAY